MRNLINRLRAWAALPHPALVVWALAGTLLILATGTQVFFRPHAAKMASYEPSMASSLRTINTAEMVYGSVYPKLGFSCSLAFLGPPPAGSRNPHAAGL